MKASTISRKYILFPITNVKNGTKNSFVRDLKFFGIQKMFPPGCFGKLSHTEKISYDNGYFLK
jgi:hypothetical protein